MKYKTGHIINIYYDQDGSYIKHIATSLNIGNVRQVTYYIYYDQFKVDIAL